MAFVLLPCDLPTWPTIQRHIRSLQEASTPAQVKQVIHTLYSLSNASMEPDLADPVKPDMFDGVETFLQEEVDAEEFFGATLKAMVAAALSLKDLKPPHGLRYSLQQQYGDVVLERGLALSLLAHIFFCTLPRRSLLTHPTLADPCFAPTLASLHRESQRVKARALLHYFTRAAEATPPGDITFSRKVMSAGEFVTLKEWLRCEASLCPVESQHEGRLEDTHAPALLACFASPNVAQPALAHATSQQVSAMLSFPELLVSALFCERLEDNEAMQVTGALRTSSVSSLHACPTFTPRQVASPPDLIHALMDADDYHQSEVLQYEEINVLRELNKAALAFSQPIPDPTSTSFSDIISVSRQQSEGSTSPPVRGMQNVGLDDRLQQLLQHRRTDDPGTSERSHRKTEKLKKKVGIVETVNDSNTCDTSETISPSKLSSSSTVSERLVKKKEQNENLQLKNKVPTQEDSAECKDKPDIVADGFITAPTTLKRRPKKKKEVWGKMKKINVASEDKGSQTDPYPAAGRERVTFADPPKTPDTTSPMSPADSDEDMDETTRLLNRVMRAIQRLEQDRPDLLAQAEKEEQQVLTPNPATIPTSKPPLPLRAPVESSKRPSNFREVERADSTEQGMAGRARRRVGVSEDGRKLSIYVSCPEEPEPPPDDDTYFSANESIDGQEGMRHPSRRRGNQAHRKASFAERLKEALAREPSDVSSLHHTDPIDRLFAQREDKTVASAVRDEEEEDDDKEGLGSSHYSFSSDYTSELEDVYEKLGEVLEESERGNIRPRTAAIARFCHGLLKRALSESCKDVTLGLDGSALKDPEGGIGGPPRSLSFTDPRPPTTQALRAPARHYLKNNGKPVVTGNWGCGSLRGDHQLKAMIQWAAASKAKAPKLVYYTCGDQNTVKLDIVCRLLGDRTWRVGDLVSTLLRYSESRLESWRKSRESELTESADSSLPESLRYRGPSLESLTLFDELIGADRPYSTMETEL